MEASLVFLRKFTDAEAAAWEDAWSDEIGQKADALARELRIALRKVDNHILIYGSFAKYD